jgi:inner membrane transporter RhtA
VGAVVLAQVPGAKDVLGILLVMTGVAVHRPAPRTAEEEAVT